MYLALMMMKKKKKMFSIRQHNNVLDPVQYTYMRSNQKQALIKYVIIVKILKPFIWKIVIVMRYVEKVFESQIKQNVMMEINLMEMVVIVNAKLKNSGIVLKETLHIQTIVQIQKHSKVKQRSYQANLINSLFHLPKSSRKNQEAEYTKSSKYQSLAYPLMFMKLI